MKEIKMYGRVFINFYIKTITGLHIGGSNTGLEIGGVDKAIVRNSLDGQPYIPGSSIRGKMRSQLEKVNGLKQNKKIGQAWIHSCESNNEYQNCPVCTIFGIPADEKIESLPARLVVRDAALEKNSKEKFDKDKISSYSEFKTEVAIDRVTSAAVPRTMERVPAGAVFGPIELVFSIYQEEDLKRLETVIQGMQLVEDDYLGGSGSRGSGKVELFNIAISARKHDDYSTLIKYNDGVLIAGVQLLANQYSTLKDWLETKITKRTLE